MPESKPFVNIRVEGLEAANLMLSNLAQNLPTIADQIIEDGGERIFADSQREVPVDTGMLQRSGVHAHAFLKSEIGYNTPYAEFVHDGTSHMPPRPFLRIAVEVNLPIIVEDIMIKANP